MKTRGIFISLLALFTYGHSVEKYFRCYWIKKRDVRSKQLASKLEYFYKRNCFQL